MKTITEEQIALFNQMENEDVEETEFDTLTEEQCEEYIEKYLRVTAASSGGLYPNCAVSGGSCSGC